MSPVSRGRKSKRSNKRAKPCRSNPPEKVSAYRGPSVAPGSAAATLNRLLGPPERPSWFDESIKRVLDNARVVMSASGPRELDQLTAELLGAELHRAVHRERQGMWFGWWFAGLVEAETDRIEEAAGKSSAEPLLWLLHGLAAMAPPSLRSKLMAPNRAITRSRELPPWLSEVPRLAATGEVCRMRDAYGTRSAVIAGFRYPDSGDRSVFLFDIDASGFVNLADAGVFDDAEQAATAWRTHVGDSAAHAPLKPVEDADDLMCVAHCNHGEEHLIRGNESRRLMDNWFRAQRRFDDLAEALRERGMPLPAVESLYHDVDATVMIEQFTAWFTDTHTTKPDPDAVDTLAGEWMEGALPETWYAASPRRVEFQLELIGDWTPDDPVTVAVKALMPDWVRWLGERAGLPEHLRVSAIEATRTA